MHPENLTLFDDPEIADIIDHINEDHSDDMKHMALGLLNLTKVQQKTLQNVTLRQIYQQGLLLDLQFAQNEPHLDNQLLAFSEPTQTLEKFNDQYVALLQRSDRKQGKKTIDIKQRQFCLQSVEAVSHHMYRLTVQTDSDLSDLPAGYAFLFDVKLPETDLKKHPRPYRYYTLRKAWQTVNENGETQNLAWIDIYCHGEKNGEISLGETWVKSLKTGDVFTSEREFPEKIDHLDVNQPQGQSLLIADETSLPTVARLLEQSPMTEQTIPPIVLTFLQNPLDLAYLDDVLAQYPATVLPIVANDDQLPHTQIFTTLKDFLQQHPHKIDHIWGGLEATTTKKLRSLLDELLQLIRDNSVLKVYWRAN